MRNFRKINEETWKMSCPICGDSKKNTKKARGFIYTVKNDMFYRCFNCQYSVSFGTFLKEVNPLLHSDYVVERYKQGINKHRANKTIELPDSKPSFSESSIYNNKILSQLIPASESKEAVDFLTRRQIPKDKWDLLYYTTEYKKLINSIIPEKFESVIDSPRVVIPYYNPEGYIFQLTGRAIDNNFMRYSNIKLMDTEFPVFGLERIDKSKKIYVVEGPIDSLFIDNCIAVSGSSFNGNAFIKEHKDNVVLVYDNEPRAIEIMRLLENSIKFGYSVCIWDSKIKQKDINEMYLDGIDAKSIIDNNTFVGASALMKYITWRKC